MPKSRALTTPPPANGNGKDPILTQLEDVQRNPFVPPQVESRPEVQIEAHADLSKKYVPGRRTGYYPFLIAQPPYIDDLTQEFGLDIYEKMMKDPVVYASMRVFTMAMLANGFELVPSLDREETDYDIAVKMRDFVQKSIDEMETPYNIVLEQHMRAFAFGSSVAEQNYKVENFGSDFSSVGGSGQLLRLANLRDVPLENAIHIQDSYNKTVGIMTQRFPGQIYPAGSYIPIDFAMLTAGQGLKGNPNIDVKNGAFDLSGRIPGFLPRNLFSILTNEMRYGDERGHSGLRPSYTAWWFKQQAISEWLSMLSKFGSPSLVGTTAQLAQGQNVVDANLNPVLGPDGAPLQKAAEQYLLGALEAFQNGSALVVPFGATVDPIQVTGNGEAFGTAITWANSEIVRGITYQFLATSEGMHQARAASDTHQDILSLSILWRKRWIAAQQQREVYARLLRYNFDMTGAKVDRYIPKLSLGMGDGFPLTTQGIAQLMRAGFIDDSQKTGIDEKLGLPKRELITVQGIKMTPTQALQRKDAEQQRQDTLDAQQQQLAAKQGSGT